MTAPTKFFPIAVVALLVAGLVPGLVAVATDAAQAMDARGRYTVYGSGELDCASWTREQKLSSSLALKDQAWVLGYISAYNRWFSKERSVLGDMSESAAIDWVDSFCQANARETLNGAVESLIFEVQAGG